MKLRFVYTPKPRQFSYKPQFYNPEEEERKVSTADGTGKMVQDVYRRYRRDAERRKKRQTKFTYFISHYTYTVVFHFSKVFMSNIIKLLPESVANQIAAGEVVQRPASVVKELLENAVDSGATQIDLVVVDSGKTLVQVIDNGKFMSVADARIAFERHATSKISRAEDLFSIRSFGFRGEALASIASVARVEMKTREKESDVGVNIKIEGSKFISQEICAAPQGTNIQVKDLFFNIPARRQFLKVIMPKCIIFGMNLIV